MLLKITERLLLLNALPNEGDFATIRTVRTVRELLAFDSDIEEGKIIVEGEGSDQRLQWPEEYEKDLDLGKAGERLVAETLRSLDKQKKLTEAHLGLWNKFVE